MFISNVVPKTSFKENNLLLLDDISLAIAMREAYPDSVDWNQDQSRSRMQSMLLLSCIGLDLKSLPKQPDTEAWVSKYKKFTTSTMQIEARYAEMMLVTMTRQFLNATVIANNPVAATLIQKKRYKKKIGKHHGARIGQSAFWSE